jgi:hypothetical protein
VINPPLSCSRVPSCAAFFCARRCYLVD